MDLQFPAGGRATMHGGWGREFTRDIGAGRQKLSPQPPGGCWLATLCCCLAGCTAARSAPTGSLLTLLLNRPSVSVEQFSRACLL